MKKTLLAILVITFSSSLIADHHKAGDKQKDARMHHPNHLLNFKECKDGNSGFVQLISLLPTSYPGHNILTEDIGEIVKNHSCTCYGYGKRFLIHGRIKDAELRGCSNI